LFKVTAFPSSVALSVPPRVRVTAALTVTAQAAVLEPSVVVAVTVALPAALAVTRPDSETVATLASLEVHVTLASVASTGLTVADS